MSHWLKLSLAALFASTLAWGPSGRAQDAPKDDDLDKFLQKVDDAGKPDRDKDKADKPSGDVPAQDKDLDNFLEKLGETKDAPAPDEKKPPGAAQPADEPEPGQKPEKPAPDALKGQEKQVDEHLEELTGRRRKKKQDDGEGAGPLAQVIKQMREVEERLGKPDTGEETRKKQEQIVKNLEQLIQQMKNSQGNGKGKPVLVMMPGQRQGQQPGTTGGKAPYTKPEKPTNKRSLAGGKEEWGHLPDALRQEMDNVFKEEGLPSREELIRRYYLSLSRKTLVREGSR